MSAREVASIVWTALSGGTKLIIRSFWTLRKAKGAVKKGSKKFYNNLVEAGIPEEHAKEISERFREPAEEALKIRNLIRFAREMG
jgi:flagellar motor switch protein FliG